MMNLPADQFGYCGKRVVVTGCSSGIGRETARLLTEAGAEVMGIDWQKSDLSLSGFIPTDLRDPASIEAAAAANERVDALFNCAGLPPMSAPLEIMQVNFIGMRALSQALLPKMTSGSAIVTVGSNGGAGWRQHLAELTALAKTGSFDEALGWCATSERSRQNAYGVSKEAVVVWTQLWSQETIRSGVRLNCTSPGAVQTPMLDAIEQVAPPAAIDAVLVPSGRRSSPEEQAVVLLMLNSPAAAYVNGVDLPVDGGFIASRTVPI